MVFMADRKLLSSYGGGGGDLSEGTKQAVLITTYIGAVSSLIGSCTILACFVTLPALRRFSFRLVAYLSISDVISSTMLLLGDPDEGSFACGFQSYVSQFATIASVLWTAAIAFVLYKAVVLRSLVASNIRRLELKLHGGVWGVSFVLMLLPIIDNSYGKAGTWCWIRNDKAGQALRLVAFYIPLWLTAAFNGVLYYFVGKTLRRTKALLTAAGIKSNNSSTRAIQMVQRLGWYPIILVGVWLFPTINRIQNWAAPQNPIAALYILTALTSSSMGFANAIAYGMNRTVRSTVVDAFPLLKRYIGRGADTDDGEDDDDDDGETDSIVSLGDDGESSFEMM